MSSLRRLNRSRGSWPLLMAIISGWPLSASPRSAFGVTAQSAISLNYASDDAIQGGAFTPLGTLDGQLQPKTSFDFDFNKGASGKYGSVDVRIIGSARIGVLRAQLKTAASVSSRTFDAGAVASTGVFLSWQDSFTVRSEKLPLGSPVR